MSTSIKFREEKNFQKAIKQVIAIFLIFCIWIVLKVVLEFPYPGVDVFIFKDPGANLLFKHGFFAVNLPYASADKIVHFMQGYLYSLLYGLWTIVVGFGFRKAIVFDSIIDLLRLVFTYVYLSYLIYTVKKTKTMLSFLLLFSILFTLFDPDRSDILATCFAMANFSLILKFQWSGKKKNFIAGALLTSLCLFTAPVIGFFTLLISLYCLWVISKKMKICFIYLFIFSICSLLQISIYLIFFLKSLILLINCYTKFYGNKGNIESFLWDCWHLSFNSTYSSKFIHIFLWMQVGTALMVKKWSKYLVSQSYNLQIINSFLKAILFCIPLSYFLFPWQPNYLVFLSYLITIYCIAIFEILSNIKVRILLILLLFINFLVPFGLSTQKFIEALTRAKDQSSKFMEEKIYSIIPFGEKIATVPAYYYILKKHYDPACFAYLPKDTLLSYPYILTSGNGTGRPGVPTLPSYYNSKVKLLRDYEIVFDSLNQSATNIFGLRITRSGYGFGGLLLKKKIQ